LVLLKAHLPNAGCRTVALTFNRVFAHREISVSKSFVHQALRTHAHAVWLARKAIRAAKPCAVAINHCWGIDLTGRADEGGTVHEILGILDHGSRRALHLARLPRKCGWALLGHLCLAIAISGRPRFVRTDNERCFTGRVFSGGLKLLGIRHQRIDLHCPWQNGRVERFFGTLKAALRKCSFNRAALDAFLVDFTRWYNELRPHLNLGGMTPLEAWEGIDPFHTPGKLKAVQFVEGWDGLLAGLRIRR
jgi:putative transposase